MIALSPLVRCTRRVALSLPLLLVAACAKKTDAATAEKADTGSATVSADGNVVTLPAAQAARIPVSPAIETPFSVILSLPARSVATATRAADLPAPLVLFETAELSSLYSEFSRARVLFARTGKQRQRLRELFQRNAAAGKDVDDAEADYAQAEATLRETEGKLREAGMDPRFLQALRPGTAFVVADVVESRAKFVRPGMPAVVEFTSLPGVNLPARVIQISETVDPTTRTVRIGLTTTDAQGSIRPGMFARVSLDQATVKAVTVPVTASVAADAKTWVFVRTAPTRFERRLVVLGADDGVRVEIREGLQPGDQVVTGNTILLKGLAFGY